MSKAVLYAYIAHDGPSETREQREGWVKTQVELDSGESVKKLSWRAPDNANGSGSWGSNNVVLDGAQLSRIVGKTMTICDAMLTDREQKEAFKQLLKDTIYGWHDEVFNRYQLDESKVE